MLRPIAQSGVRRAITMVVCVMGIAWLTSGSIGAADDQHPYDVAQDDHEPDEMLLGVIETPPARLVPQIPDASAPALPSAVTDPRSPDELFRLASEELAAGRTEAAQRLFEILVASAPSHPKSREARRRLQVIYRGLAEVPAAETLSAGSRTGPEVFPPGSAPATEAPARVGDPRRVVLPVPVARSVEENFVIEAGDRVFFAPRSADLGARARVVLSAQARWLKRNPSLYAVVEGHADDPPLDDAELERLALARAQAVYWRLVEEGVVSHRLGINPLGRQKPVADCAAAHCSAQNRRAVTVLTPQKLSELPSGETDQRSWSQ